jgi:hypothetical protein
MKFIANVIFTFVSDLNPSFPWKNTIRFGIKKNSEVGIKLRFFLKLTICDLREE